MSESVSQVYVVDDDVSVREACRQFDSVSWAQRENLCLGAGVLGKFARGSTELLGTGYPAPRHKRIRTATGTRGEGRSDPDNFSHWSWRHSDLGASNQGWSAGVFDEAV